MNNPNTRFRWAVLGGLVLLTAAFRLVMADSPCALSEWGCEGAWVHLGDASWAQSGCPPGTVEGPTDPSKIPVLHKRCDSVTGTAGAVAATLEWHTDTNNGACGLVVLSWVVGTVSVDVGGTGCKVQTTNGPCSAAFKIYCPQKDGRVKITATVTGNCPSCPPESTNQCRDCSVVSATYTAVGYVEVQLDEDQGGCASACDDDASDAGDSGASCSGGGGGGGGGCGFRGCGSGLGAAASTGTLMNDSLNFQLNLGRSSPTRNSGYISLYADQPSANLSKPVALDVPFNRSGVTVLRRGTDNAIKQVLSPQGLVNVSTKDAYEYHLECFYSSDVGSIGGDGLYTTNAAAYCTWIIKNPDGSSAYNRLFITENRGGVERQFQYTYTSSSLRWDLLQPDGSTTISHWFVPDGSDATITNEFRQISSGSTLVRKLQKKLKSVSGLQDPLLLQQIEGDGTTTRTTTYDYYSSDSSNGASTNKLRRADYPNGNWAYFTYDYGFDDSTSDNEHGDLVGIAYSNDPQSTPGVTYAYDRRGRQNSIVQGSTTTTLTFDNANDQLTESYTGGTLDGLSVTNGFDQFLRRTNVASLNGSTVLTLTSYAYDNASRLGAVTNGNYNAIYSYVANSPLVSQISFRSNSTVRMTTTKQYDFLNRLTSISSVPSAASAVSFEYQYNNANQRTRCRLADGSLWMYEYDSLGQLTSGRKFWPDWTPVAGQQFTYAYDDIGNRVSTSSGGDENGANLRSATYGANSLNQYTNRDVPGYIDIMGLELATNTVTVNSQTPYRKGEYFRKELSVNNSSSAVWTTVTVAAPTETTVTGNIFTRKTAETFTFDADGNTTGDGQWNYTWDAENRLVRIVSATGVGPQIRIDCEYDSKGRRVRKKVWPNTSGSSSPTNDLAFTYDRWNVLAETDAAHTPLHAYVWAAYCTGTQDSVVSVGSLIATIGGGGAQFFSFEGSGSVAALTRADDGSESARYEYGPFAEPIKATGIIAASNPYTFSGQLGESESDLLYYGYRYYAPCVGRWANRDPLGELGFKVLTSSTVSAAPSGSRSQRNLGATLPKRDRLPETREQENPYAFVGNEPIRKTDVLGLLSDSGVKICYENELGFGQHQWIEYPDGSAGFYPGESGIWPGGPGLVVSPDLHVGDADKLCQAIGISSCCDRGKLLKCIKDRVAQDMDSPPWYNVPDRTCSWWSGKVISDCLKKCGM